MESKRSHCACVRDCGRFGEKMAIVDEPKDIFISYGREEGVREFVRQLKADLEANGVSVWLDVDDIPTGSDFHVEIGVALKTCRALIPVLTKKYVNSRYCKGELYVANGKKKLLFPVVYENGWDEGEQGAGVNYIVAAFNWAFFRPNQDDYQDSLDRLVKGAKLKLNIQSEIPIPGEPSKNGPQSEYRSDTAFLEPVEKQLGVVKYAREQLGERSLELDKLQTTLIADVQREVGKLQNVLESRRDELIDQIEQAVQGKKKNLAAQRDEVDTLQTKLEECLSFVREGGSQGEVMNAVLKQIKELTGDFNPGTLSPCESANIKFTASQTELATCTSVCQQFGKVHLQVFSEKCHVTGKGLEVVKYGERATVMVHVVDDMGKACPIPLECLTCELESESTCEQIDCSMKETEASGQYEISYQATSRGRHQLHIKAEGEHIKGSPFPVTVKLPVEKLGTPIKTIKLVGVKKPSCVVIDRVGNIIVPEASEHRVSIFSPAGEKQKSFGIRGSNPGQFNQPKGIALDCDDNILVTDNQNNCIKKFSSTSSGAIFIAASVSNFNHPVGIGVHPQSQKVYVADNLNHCVQILNPDLTFSSSFGSRGSSANGQFQNPYDVAFDSRGNVYVVDGGNHRIQVFTADGHFLRKFGKKGRGPKEWDWPNTIAIDDQDVVYVVDQNNNRVSVFTCEGKFLTTFGTKGNGPGQFTYPYGVAVDRNGLVYVSDNTGRIQIF